MDQNDKEEKIDQENKQTTSQKQEKKTNRRGFWKKLVCSVGKIESYPEMATEGVPKAISYMIKLVAILAVVVCLGIVYQTNQVLTEGIDYLNKDFPDFSYQEGTLTVVSEQPIILEEAKLVGKVIVDTKEHTEEEINQYTNSLTEAGNGVVVLKDKIIIKNESITGTITYAYQDILGQVGITEFTKQDVINFAASSQMIQLYLSLFITMFMYAFVMYFLNTLTYVLVVSLFGSIANLVTKLRMRYAAIFNMAVYAITLSTLLNIVYVGVNIWIPFGIKYFEVMYISVAVVYLVAAIFMIKADWIKRQGEIIEIQEVQKQVKEEIEQKEREKEEKKQEENKPKDPVEPEKDPEDKKQEKPEQKGPEPEAGQA